MKKVIISKNGKYCSNPETHILGTLPCCKNLIIDLNFVEKNDVIEIEKAGLKRK